MKIMKLTTLLTILVLQLGIAHGAAAEEEINDAMQNLQLKSTFGQQARRTLELQQLRSQELSNRLNQALREAENTRMYSNNREEIDKKEAEASNFLKYFSTEKEKILRFLQESKSKIRLGGRSQDDKSDLSKGINRSKIILNTAENAINRIEGITKYNQNKNNNDATDIVSRIKSLIDNNSEIGEAMMQKLATAVDDKSIDGKINSLATNYFRTIMDTYKPTYENGSLVYRPASQE